MTSRTILSATYFVLRQSFTFIETNICVTVAQSKLKKITYL